MTNRHSEQLQQAIELIGQGQLEEAQDILIDIVQEDPNNEDAWICLADTVDNLDEKIGIFSNCLEKAPNSFIVRKEYEKCLIEKSRQTQEDHVPDENLPEIVYGYQDASPESEEDTSSTDALQWLFNEIDGKTPPEDADADRPDSEELEETEEAEGADESGDEEEEPSESPFTELRADLEDASDFSGEDLRDLFNDHHEQDAQAFEMGYIAGTPPRKPFMEEDLIDITNPFEEDDSTDGLPDVMGRISSDYQKAAHEEENGGEFEKWEELTASIEDQSQIDLDDTNPALDLHEWIKENPFSTTEELEGLDEEALKKVHEFTQSVNTLNQDESSLADATDEELSSELDSLLEGLSEPDDEDSIDSKELNQKLLHVNAFFDDEEEEEDILQLHHDENSLLTGTPPFNIDLAPRDFNQIKDELELESDDEGGEFMLEDELDSDILPEELPTDQPKQSADEPNIDVSYDDDVDLEDLSEIETLGDSDQFQPVSKPKIVVEYGEAINPEDLYFEVSGNDYGSGLRANIYDEEDMEDEESLPSEADRAMENEVGMSLDVDTLELPEKQKKRSVQIILGSIIILLIVATLTYLGLVMFEAGPFRPATPTPDYSHLTPTAEYLMVAPWLTETEQNLNEPESTLTPEPTATSEALTDTEPTTELTAEEAGIIGGMGTITANDLINGLTEQKFTCDALIFNADRSYLEFCEYLSLDYAIVIQFKGAKTDKVDSLQLQYYPISGDKLYIGPNVENLLDTQIVSVPMIFFDEDEIATDLKNWFSYRSKKLIRDQEHTFEESCFRDTKVKIEYIDFLKVEMTRDNALSCNP